MKRICGYDMNGWRDFAARNWTIDEDGEVIEEPSLVSTEVLPSVVRVGPNDSSHWIGGVQADLAPHGRGNGWGDIGQPNRRQFVRNMVNDSAKELSAALTGLSGVNVKCDHGVLALDDTPMGTEAMQETLLKALRDAGVRDRLLVWRPVLVALFAISEHLVFEDQAVGVICHDRNGFSVQKLRIRREQNHDRILLAPERRRAGILSKCDCGYEGLISCAERSVGKAFQGKRHADLAKQSRTVGRLALGVPTQAEVLRADNRDWVILDLPDPIGSAQPKLSDEACERLSVSDSVFFETLAEGARREALREAFSELLGKHVHAVPVDAVAKGALCATKRRARGEPIYFDFLPTISTIVQQTNGKVENYDLISKKATLPAGRLYRSPIPAPLALPTQKDRVTVYLRKDGAQWPRKATVKLGSKMPKNTRVEVWVEQAPVSGHASILLRPEERILSRQYIVDWEKSHEVRKDWNQIIEDLATRPSIPDRLVLPCNISTWYSGKHDNLIEIINQAQSGDPIKWDQLAKKLQPPKRSCEYAVSSDGEVPNELNFSIQQQFNELTYRATEIFYEQLAGRKPFDTGPLKFLTWQFRRCPPEIGDELLAYFNGDGRLVRYIDNDGEKPITKRSRQILAHHGLGRIAHKRHERRALEILLSRPVWKWDMETACVAFLLSRSETVVDHLNRQQVECLAEHAVRRFDYDYRTSYTRFRYVRPLVVGLLRWRHRNPQALITGPDPVANALNARIKLALPDIEKAAGLKKNQKQKATLDRYFRDLQAILKELEGKGTNPELLLDLFGPDEAEPAE